VHIFPSRSGLVLRCPLVYVGANIPFSSPLSFNSERNSWFSVTSKDFGTYRKSINACGDGLPSELNPTCDRFLGDTPSCECMGKKRVEKVTVKVRATSAKCGKPQQSVKSVEPRSESHTHVRMRKHANHAGACSCARTHTQHAHSH
jgi:hypothetical protein